MALSNDSNFKTLLKTIEKAYKKLHNKGGYNPDDLEKVPEFKKIITDTTALLQRSVQDNDLSENMLKRLKEDMFYFSGYKTNAQLLEASRHLLDSDNTIKSFSKFSKDVADIKKNYNQNYLEAEYDFAVGSVLMAERYENFSNSDRYMLQYRTANDERVRETHQALHNITLPKTDVFWDKFFPPNGWRCRCTTVEVLASSNKKSDSKKANNAGDIATTKINKNGKNSLEIFRFNAGKQKIVFPPNHAYKKVVGAKKAEAAVTKILGKNKVTEPLYTPKNLVEYEKKFKTKIDRSFFEYLNKDTVLTEKHLDTRVRSKGAYYMPGLNYVRIPYSQRAKVSKWYRKSIIYHEFGHAADWQNGYRGNKLVKDLMAKYRKKYRAKSFEKFKEIDQQIYKDYKKARDNNDDDAREQISSAADTLMSLNTRFGYGHSKRYFSRANAKEAEFIAHMFENKFNGNKAFKKLMPELYKEMIDLVDTLKPKK